MGGQKRYDPTSKKLKKAREDGDVAKSRELTGFFVLLTGLLGIFILRLSVSNLSGLFVKNLALATDFNHENMVRIAAEASAVLALILGPVLLCLAISAVGAEVFQVGFHLNFKNLAIRFSRINFFQGIKRMWGLEEGESGVGFSGKIFFEVVKLFTVIGLLGLAGGAVVWRVISSGLRADLGAVEELIGFCNHGMCFLVSVLLGALFPCAIADFLMQRKNRWKRLRMDAQELRREFRESEGDPEIRGLRKQLHQELLINELVEGVRKAKVLVVNDSID